MSKTIHLYLGGTWHDFSGFAAWATPLMAESDWTVEAARDLDRLLRLDDEAPALVMMYTCLGEKREDGSPAQHLLSIEQAAALSAWVGRGGALLALHAATVAAQYNPVFRKLVGGVFIEHPPAFSFTVTPLFGEHPITLGIPAFSLQDELYCQRVEPDVQLHMVTFDRGVAYPMVWSRLQGLGRVAHVAMGHDRRAWNQPAYRQLLTQAAGWAMKGL